MFKNLKLDVSLKRSFSILFGLQLILIIVLAILILTLYQNQKNLAKTRDQHFNSYLLADELRQSSDDLTRLARTYVATANPEFEREYWAVLDIRNGKIPRPTDYDRIYWDFVSSNGIKPRADGETISLQDLMIREGFTKEELAKLSLAQKKSNDLVKAETIAMNAMKGLFDDGSGNFIIKKEPDPQMASQLMNDENYHKIKAEIMGPIDDFYVMFEKRTEAAVVMHLQYSKSLFLAIIILIFFIMLMFFYAFITVRRQINQREQAREQLNDANRGLEQKIKERTKKIEQSDKKVMATLENSERLNKMMVGREIKMIELKNKIRELENENKK
jgi:methyl-accepting chemotaxis protein